MTENGKYYLSVIITICLAICIFAGTIYFFRVSERVKMAGLGYEQTTIAGCPYPVWQKTR